GPDDLVQFIATYAGTTGGGPQPTELGKSIVTETAPLPDAGGSLATCTADLVSFDVFCSGLKAGDAYRIARNGGAGVPLTADVDGFVDTNLPAVASGDTIDLIVGSSGTHSTVSTLHVGTLVVHLGSGSNGSCQAGEWLRTG